MILIFLKYQLRNRQAFIFLLVLFLFTIRQFNGLQVHSNPYLYGFLTATYLFANVIIQCMVPLPLLYITNAKMVNLVRSFNISLLVWLNVTDGIITLYNLFEVHREALSCLQGFINMNATLFLAFIVGNRISFSDLYTMKSRTWGRLAASFLFIVLVIPFGAGMALINNTWPITTYLSLFFLLLFIVIWWFDSRRYKQITQFSHLITGYDNDRKN